MRTFKRIIASFLAAMLVVGLIPSTVKADNTYSNLYLMTNVDKTLEIPLTLDASTETFYVSTNINPGDVMTATVIFENVSNEDIEVRIADVKDQLGTTDAVRLLDTLDLTISTNGSPIYRGKHSAVTSPLTQWMSLPAGDILTMTIKVELPLWEADNTLQGAEMKVKYVFEARADIDMSNDDDNNKDKDKDKNQIIKTGIDAIDNMHPATMVIILVAVALVAGYVIFVVAGKKNKKNNP